MLINETIITNIIKDYGTPIYIYSLNIIEQQLDKLRDNLPEYFNIFYSMKANPNIGILANLKKSVNGIEVASLGELYTAMKSGYTSKEIIFVGPGKTHYELEYAIKENILSIVAESLEEIFIINKICEKYNTVMSISIRINPKAKMNDARIKMGGGAKQFGIDEELIDFVIKESFKCKNIKINGIHFYLGTQVLNSTTLINNFENSFKILDNLENNYKLNISLVDFGGGFGIPYFDGEYELDLSNVKESLNLFIKKYIRDENIKNYKFIVESGRFILANSGLYVTEVLYKKKSRGKTFIVVNGGSNHHSASAGIGRFLRNNFPIEVLNKENENRKEIVDIVGPLCTPTDVLGQNIELPHININDKIVILNSGAYGLTSSFYGLISHGKPAEILVYNNKYYQIRKRDSLDDIFQNQIKVLV
ncbi:diaminopimelate decarboxylase [Tissierella sp. P1]|uniref:diaminopimelate decarboxylase n=1 Tax=Tissierella sp. P1 TaxID=1280483 RepID=UPI001303C321|nr:diaminopimelate decarboxylase [Tissierella sp. P1]